MDYKLKETTMPEQLSIINDDRWHPMLRRGASMEQRRIVEIIEAEQERMKRLGAWPRYQLLGVVLSDIRGDDREADTA